MTYPTSDSAANFAGILGYLGWGTAYNFQELSAAVSAYLETSNVAVEDRGQVKGNFIHTSIDHTDFLQAYYGAKATFGTDANGLQTVAFNQYP